MGTLLRCTLLACVLLGCSRTQLDLVDPCAGVRCGSDLEQCDPVDGLCKCGPAGLNLICGEHEVCRRDGADTFACLNVRCELVLCERGESCNPSTGTCSCGTGPEARTCGASQSCENGRCSPGPCDGVTCTLGTTCHPDDGTCRCGEDICGEGVVCLDGACDRSVDACELYPPECRRGEVCVAGSCRCAGGDPCGDGQQCVDGACVTDPCWGVNCPGGTVCGPGDGACHCGDPGGPICAAGQACVAGACVSRDVCRDVTCPPGMVCDPDPDGGGACRCGGVGAQFPRCGQGQTCDLSTPFPSCKGGDPCRDRDCGKELPGSSCDPEDGICKCGGLDGVACPGAGAACAVEDGENVCTEICDPLGRDCTGEEACYYEPRRALSICRVQGSTEPGRSCKESGDCVAGAYCAPLQDGSVCRALCNRDTQEGCPPEAWCAALSGAPDPRLGQCLILQ